MAAWDKDLDNEVSPAWEKDLDRVDPIKAKANKPLGKQATPAAQIAANPAVRFAVGAGEPMLGAVQRLGSGNKGLRQAFPLMSLAATINKPDVDKSLEAYNKLKAEGGHTGTDWFGLAGNVLSPLSLAAGKLPIPATIAGRTALGAGVGAAGGALAPAETEEQARQNAAFGAVAGGVLAPVISIAAKAYDMAANKLVRPVSNLFTKEGPMNIVRDYIRGQKVVGEDNLPVVLKATRGVDELIPGGKPTVAEAVSGVPEGSPLNALQTLVAKTGGGPSARFGQRILDQQQALSDAVKIRKKVTDPMRTSALESANAGGVKSGLIPVEKQTLDASGSPVRLYEPGSVLDALDEMTRQPGDRASDVVTRTLGTVKAKIASLTDNTGNIDARDLYTVRKEIGNTIKTFSKETANWDKKLTSKLEREIQLNIDDAIEKGGGVGWKEYLAEFAKRSQAMDAFKARQELSNPLQPTNLSGGINIAEETRPHMPNLLSRPAMMANFLMRKAGAGVEPKVDKALADILLDPSKFTEEMSKLSPSSRIQVEKLLRNYNALSFGGAAAQ
jgi:hypothetical protein